VITVFSGLLQKHKWGASLPYMISGAYSLPQKDVMEWTANRLYSFNNIVRALSNKKSNVADNAKYPILKPGMFENVIIVGGGANAVSHLDGIRAFIGKRQSIALIHATARNAAYYHELGVPQYVCLVGSEGKRLAETHKGMEFNGTCVLPPYPREMGTDVPDFVRGMTFELPGIDFTDKYFDSCTAVALQTAALCCSGEIYTVGYDGYADSILLEKERVSIDENSFLFSAFKKRHNKKLTALTPSLYNELDIVSVYQLI
jgi:4-hydroxy 2-oxovalerate aldolase